MNFGRPRDIVALNCCVRVLEHNIYKGLLSGNFNYIVCELCALQIGKHWEYLTVCVKLPSGQGFKSSIMMYGPDAYGKVDSVTGRLMTTIEPLEPGVEFRYWPFNPDKP